MSDFFLSFFSLFSKANETRIMYLVSNGMIGAISRHFGLFSSVIHCDELLFWDSSAKEDDLLGLFNYLRLIAPTVSMHPRLLSRVIFCVVQVATITKLLFT